MGQKSGTRERRRQDKESSGTSWTMMWESVGLGGETIRQVKPVWYHLTSGTSVVPFDKWNQCGTI